MRALVNERYGDPRSVLKMADIDEPTPGAGQVVVRQAATSVNAADWHMVLGEPRVARLDLGVRRPKATVPGCDVAGTVIAVGDGANGLQAGTRVFGTSFGAGFGAFAQQVVVPADLLMAIPAGIETEQAAAVPLAGLTAVQAVREARIEQGQKVMVIGASGGVGSYAVQLARRLGAVVTGTASTANLGIVESLGIEHFIDHSVTDPCRGGRDFDAVIQLGGTAWATSLCRRLRRDGTLVQLSGDSTGKVIGPMWRLVAARIVGPFVPQQVRTFTVQPSRDGLEVLASALADGTLRAATDRVVEFDEVPAAVHDLSVGRVRGKTVARFAA